MELSDIAALPWLAPADRLALPHGEAIYFLLDRDSAPLYIGATVHLKDRLGCHRWVKPGVDVGIERIAWMPAEWPASEMLEAELIFKFKPALNVRGKRVKLHPENSLWHRPAPWTIREALEMDAPPPAP